jgi:hypothetical protein
LVPITRRQSSSVFSRNGSQRLLCGPPCLCGKADVGHDDQRLHALGLCLLRDGLAGRLVGAAVDDDVVAASGEIERTGAANVLAGAGDEGGVLGHDNCS